MKLVKIILLCVACFATNVHAQDLKILVNKKGKVGFADANGNEVIKCVYESVNPFSDGIAIVTKSKKKGIIDTSGTVLLPISYDQISKWTDELFLVKKGKKVGLANKQGKIVLDVNYSHISKLNTYGKALLALGGKQVTTQGETYFMKAKYGVIDAKGTILITPKYVGLYEFSFNGAGVLPFNEGKRLEFSYHTIKDTLKTDCSYLGFSKNMLNIYGAGLMDSTGRELVKMGLYDFIMYPSENMVRYYNAKRKKTICGYHNIETGKGIQVAEFKNGINEFNFWSHGDFRGGVAPVNGSAWSFVDKAGNVVRTGFSALKYSFVTEKWAAQNQSGTWDVFDKNNNDVAHLSGYTDILFPVNFGDKEFYSVQKDGKYGAINAAGETVIPFEYEQALGNSFDFVTLQKNGKWGVVSVENQLLIPHEYIGIMLPSDRSSKHFWVMKSDSLCYHLNLETGHVADKGYKIVTPFVNGVAHVIDPNMQVDNTIINRALLFPPNTAQSKIDAVDFNNYKNSFGYLLYENDEYIMDLPVSTLYRDAVLNIIKEYGYRKLTKTEKKRILLHVTRENRSYDLNLIMNESEWDF